MTQLDFLSMERGTSHRGRCAYLRPSALTGTTVEGLVIVGSCTMGRGTVYDRDCDECSMWEVKA